MLLIQSKRITRGNYTESDVVGRLLKSRALLGITIERTDEGYRFQLLDPLGNSHCNTPSMTFLCDAIKKRTEEISNISRIPSKSIGEVNKFQVEDRFIDVVRDFGNRFSKFVNAVNPNRLLGNASTRCESGFPAFKDDGRIFVSRRNVDKKTLSSKDFVEVEVGPKCVNFYGHAKPSVDTPIQILLFSYFSKIKYMIHGHVYVKGAPMTENKIPCGFLEEVNDVLDVIHDTDVEQFAINLRGHGCLICCKDLSYFDTIKLKARPFPES